MQAAADRTPARRTRLTRTMSERSARMNAKQLPIIERVQRGDRQAEEELVRSNAGLVRNMVRRFHNSPGLDADDMTQEANLVLLKCARAYRSTTGSAWSSYAGTCIYRRLNRLRQREQRQDPGRVAHGRFAGSESAWLGELLASMGEVTLPPDGEPTALEVVVGLLDRLPERERKAITLRYRIGERTLANPEGPTDPRPVLEVGRMLGVYRVTVGRAITQGIDLIRQNLSGQVLDG